MKNTNRLIWSKTQEIRIALSEKGVAGWFRCTVAIGVITLVTMQAAGNEAKALDPNALPTGGQVVAGQANIAQSGNAMTVNQQTDKMIANWNTFNIGQNASVAFQQPGASSVALNRILDQNPSQIFGRLSANGQVFLLNPAGVYFGATAQVDVGGLVAASLNLTNENFLSGKYLFENSGSAGSITNQGTIRTADGGYIAFMAPQIINEGVINTPGGVTALAAGDKVSLDFTGDRLVNFTINRGAIDALIENKGLIQADGGTVLLTAKAADSLTQAVVNNTGIIEANTLQNKEGRIVLDAEGGMTTVSGKLDVSSTEVQGGSIIAAGDRVWVKSGAFLTASGATGGGEVLAGGSWQNSDTSVHQAVGTVIEQGARLEANATNQGDGGTVVAWSDVTNPDSVTRAYGTFEAKGGPNGGDGGRIETSGHWLDVSGSTGSASAFLGKAGLWLFDPYSVTISGADANGTWTGANPDVFSPNNTGATIDAATIAGKLESGTSVTVTTNGGGAEIGDITVSSAITKASGATDVTLTLQAANSIAIDQSISNTGGAGKLHVLLDADNNSGARDGGGIILLNNDIDTGGGNLSFGTGATLSLNGVTTMVGGDVYVAGAGARGITTAGGNVTVNGEMIIANTNGLTINTTGVTNGNVSFGGRVNSGNAYQGVSYAGKAWSEALANAASGTGLNTGDTYLATITTRLENAIASRVNSYNEGWLGARRVTGIGSNLTWRWIAGPEGAMDGGNGLAFFTQNTQSGRVTNAQNGTPVDGAFNNWNDGEPNNWNGAAPAADNTEYESILQFTGTLGKWNDLPGGPLVPVAAHTLNTYVKETNLAASPLTVNAGSGTVTFSGAVGASKALSALTVTATTIAINGGAVTTEGAQTYTGNIILGAANTTLSQTNAGTDFTLQANKTITNATGADASVTIKTTGNIILDAASSISSSSGKLNTVLWSDTDANGGGVLLKNNAAIDTNGGHLWMGGGSGSVVWNGLTVGNGYASGSGFGLGDNQYDYTGVLLGTSAASGISLLSKGGDMALYGENSANNSGHKRGIFSFTGLTMNSGAGKIGLYGKNTSTYNAGDAGYKNAVELYGGTMTSASAAADAITIVGDAGTAGTVASKGVQGVQMGDSMVVSVTAGGGINITGTTNAGAAGDLADVTLGSTPASILSDSGPITVTGQTEKGIRLLGDAYVGYKAGSSITASTSDITLVSDKVTLAGTDRLQSSGTLTIKPYTAATTIGIAGGTGTLSLPASYFSTNFTNGFSGIVVGSANAGDINIGSTALTYNDPLTLKTAGNITTNSGAAITGGAGQTAHLTLWADADVNNNGYIFIYDGNTINTNGGDITMAGGLDDGANGGTASDGIPDGYAVSTVATASGVSIGRNANAATAATTITSSGGNIVMRGKSTGGNPSMGIHYAYGGTLDAGSGTLTMLGEATSYAGIELSAWLDGAGTSYLDINAGTVEIRGISSNTNYHGLASSQLNNEYTRITAGAGGITLYGHNTANANKGVEISQNMTTTDGGNITVESPNYVAIYAGANAHSFNAGTGNTTLKTNILSIGANHTLAGSGALTVEPYTAGREINIGTTGAGTLDIASSYFSTNFTNGFSGITVGNAAAGAITVGGATTFQDSATLRNNSTIAVNGAVTANENLILTGNGAMTQSAALSVTGTTGISAGAGNNVTLTNASNDFTGAVSVASGNNVSIIDSNALTLGTVTATGTVDIATLTGNLTLTGAVATTDATASAIKLNAGKNAAAGTAAGGDILVTGGSVSTGAGGFAALYSGSVSGSTGLTALIGSGSGRFRYASDESTTNYSTALIAGVNAVYREQPTVTVTANDDSKVYDGAAYSGGNGVTYAGFVNNDTSAGLGGVLAYGGTSQGAVNAGGYTIVPSGLSSGLGYNLSFANGTLTINPAALALSVTAQDAAKTYGTQLNFTGTEFTSVGLQGGDTIGSVTLTSVGAPASAPVGSYSIIPSNATGGTFNPANYNISYVNGVLTVNPAALTITAMNDIRTYSGTAYSGGNGVTYTGFVNGETESVLGGTLAYGGTSQGAINAGSYSIIPSGLTASNYSITYNNGTLTINPAALTLSVIANDASKTYGAQLNFNGTEFTSFGLQGGDTIGSVTLTSEGAPSSAPVGSYSIIPSNATGGTFNPANYNISYVNGVLTVNPAALTITVANAVKTYGQTATFAGTEFTSSGLQNSETIGSVALTSQGSRATASVADGPYAIVASDAGGGTFNPANYNISYVNGALTVNPAALTITANDDSKTYNGSPYSGGNGVTYNGFANGETADVLNGTLTYGGTSQGAILVGSYGIDPLGLTSSSYNITFISGILTINAAPVYPDQTAIDTQSGFNGTGQTSVGSPGAPNTFFVGPGAGSGAIQTAQLFTMPIGGNATLSTSTLSSPVSFSAEGQTTTLTVTQTAASDPMAAIGTLPLFVQEAGASPALRGNFTVRESTSAISLTEAATTNAGIAEPPAADLTGLSPIPFTLTLENGMALQLTVMVTRDGVLMVSAPASTGSIDIRQAILMGAQIAKQELKTALRNLKAAVLVRR